MLSKSIAKMLLQLVFTNLLINSLYFLSEGSNEVIQATPYQTFVKFKQLLTEINADQTAMRSVLQLIKSQQNMIKIDGRLIKEELNVLNDTFNMVEKLLGRFKQKSKSIPRNCAEALSTSRQSGIYEIQIPRYSEQSFKVACEAETRYGNWTIVLRRMDGSENFDRNKTEYEEGFGNLTGEFFLGLDKIHALTSDQPQELIVLLEDFKGKIRYEAYDKFAIANRNNSYNLETLAQATGNAGDSLRNHQGVKFSSNCGHIWTSGWWYKNCHESSSNLMGRYNDTTSGKGIKWDYGDDEYKYSWKRAVMMIRPRTENKRFLH